MWGFLFLADRRPISTNLQECARQRAAKLTDFTDLLKAGDCAFKEQAKREIATAVEKDKREVQAAEELKFRDRPNHPHAEPHDPPNRNLLRASHGNNSEIHQGE